MRILFPTDSFPPGCGGGGLSAYHLAAGLAERGHEVEVVKLVPGAAGVRETEHAGLPMTVFGYRRPETPGLGPLYLYERVVPQLRRYLARRLARGRYDLVHAQHVLSILPSVAARGGNGGTWSGGREGGTTSGRAAVVSTIRDFWPVCFWDTSLSGEEICPGCSPANLRTCTRRRKPALWPASRLFIPYMRRTLGRRQATLAESDGVICVSTWVMDALLERAPEIDGARVTRVPNFVDCEALQDDGGGRPQGRALAEAGLAGKPYLLYAGKLAANKGVLPMLRAVAAAGVKVPLVAAARGELQDAFLAEARRLGVEVKLLGWRPNAEVHDLMRGAVALLFPSVWPEPLARTLLEATALGTPVVATSTGGTTDIVLHGETGFLAHDEAGFSREIARLVAEPGLRGPIFDRARERARKLFDKRPVLDLVERVYAEAIARAGRAA